MFREKNTKDIHSVTLSSLMTLCKDKEEQDKLYNAIADMELAGQATLTMDSKIRTKSYELALKDAGLSEETVQSILEKGDMSGFIGSKESQLAESYLGENLKNGHYVEKRDVDAIIQQYQKNIKTHSKNDFARTEFELSMHQLCKDAKVFSPETLTNEQIKKGKNGKEFEIYRNDKESGLSVSVVPVAKIKANRDEIVAELKQKYNQSKTNANSHLKGAAQSAKDLVGDAEQQCKATVHMTAHALMYIFHKVFGALKKSKMIAEAVAGNVNIQNTVERLIGLEKDEMTKEIENPIAKMDDNEKQKSLTEASEKMNTNQEEHNSINKMDNNDKPTSLTEALERMNTHQEESKETSLDDYCPLDEELNQQGVKPTPSNKEFDKPEVNFDFTGER